MANYQQPEVITKDVHKTLQWQIEKAHDSFRDSLLSPVGFWKLKQMQYCGAALLGTVLLFFSFQAWHGFRALDSLAYDALSLPLQFGVLVGLLLTCWQVFVLWNLLRSFLVSLESIPLAHAFLPPSRSGGGRPIWVRHLNLQSLDIHLRKRIVLHDLARLVPPGPGPSREHTWYDESPGE